MPGTCVGGTSDGVECPGCVVHGVGYDQEIEPARRAPTSHVSSRSVMRPRRSLMYQPCTSTAVNHGEQRSPTVMRKRVVSRSKAALPGTAESFGPGLITRRSWVQIPPPPPIEAL